METKNLISNIPIKQAKSIRKYLLMLLSVLGYFILCLEIIHNEKKSLGEVSIKTMFSLIRKYLLYLLLPSVIFLIFSRSTEFLSGIYFLGELLPRVSDDISSIIRTLGMVYVYVSGAVLTYKTMKSISKYQ